MAGWAAHRGWQLALPPTAVVAGFVAATAVGGIAGVYPAARRPPLADRRPAGHLTVALFRCRPGSRVRRALVGLTGDSLEPVAVLLPPGRCHRVPCCSVVRTEPSGAVDELADDVGMAGVAFGLGDHVDEDLVQRHLARSSGHQGNAPAASSGKAPMLASECAQARWYRPDDLVTRLVGSGPHVRVRLGVILQPRQRLTGRSTEGRRRSTKARCWRRA